MALLLAALAALAAATPAAPARADVLPPGQKAVGYCFAVANLASYPDAVVLAYYAYGGAQRRAPICINLSRRHSQEEPNRASWVVLRHP